MNLDYYRDDKSLNDLPSVLKQRLCLTNPYTGLNNVEELKQVVKRELKKHVKIECKYYKKNKGESSVLS